MAVKSLEELRALIKRCKKCSTMNKGQKRVPGKGVVKPAVFFLGEAPGRLGADKTGCPFTKDKSGKLLQSMISKIGLSTTSNVYITNVVKCNPRNDQETNRRPSKEEIDNCKEYMETELRIVQAKVIVPLGSLACQVLGIKIPMKKCSAKAYRNGQRLIFPMYHPGYVVRGRYQKSRYYADFRGLEKLLQNTISTSPNH